MAEDKNSKPVEVKVKIITSKLVENSYPKQEKPKPKKEDK